MNQKLVDQTEQENQTEYSKLVKKVNNINITDTSDIV